MIFISAQGPFFLIPFMSFSSPIIFYVYEDVGDVVLIYNIFLFFGGGCVRLGGSTHARRKIFIMVINISSDDDDDDE